MLITIGLLSFRLGVWGYNLECSKSLMLCNIISPLLSQESIHIHLKEKGSSRD